MIRLDDVRTIVWFELEKTGPDPQVHDLVEIAAVATDVNWNRIGEPFNSLIVPESIDWADKMTAEARDRLNAQQLLGRLAALDYEPMPARMHTLDDVRESFNCWLDSVNEQGPCHVASLRLSKDLPWLRAKFPRALSRMHFRAVDLRSIELFLSSSALAVSAPEQDMLARIPAQHRLQGMLRLLTAARHELSD